MRIRADDRRDGPHIGLARFRHLTGRGVALRDFAEAALREAMRLEGAADPSVLRHGLVVGVSGRGFRPHPTTLLAWADGLLRLDGRETTTLANGLVAFAARRPVEGDGVRPTLELTVTGEEGAAPVHEVVVLQLDHVLGGDRAALRGYGVYVHTLIPEPGRDGLPPESGCLSYAGLTRQGWQKRYAQHLGGAWGNSPTLLVVPRFEFGSFGSTRA